ncbi:MAG: hypothetical protein JXR77_09410, partial [Lentisphaeria bacterium]|nr:hypothetical protein [Lentisphaeria bacterium]
MRQFEARKRDVPTVDALIEMHLQAAEADGLRERSLKDLRLRLTRFAEIFGPRKVNDIRPAEAKQWL